MKSPKRAAGQPASPTAAGKSSAAAQKLPADSPDDSIPPLKPQRKWFVILSIVFALWVAFLLVLWLTTVHRAA